MSTQPIALELQPGPEMDRELGERLGVEPITDWAADAHASYPAFSTDGNAILQLIDLMAKRGYWCRTESTDHGCDAWFIRRNGSLPRVSGSNRLPAAIAHAALKALRSEAAR